jgi:hypothetical protein
LGAFKDKNTVSLVVGITVGLVVILCIGLAYYYYKERIRKREAAFQYWINRDSITASPSVFKRPTLPPGGYPEPPATEERDNPIRYQSEFSSEFRASHVVDPYGVGGGMGGDAGFGAGGGGGGGGGGGDVRPSSVSPAPRKSRRAVPLERPSTAQIFIGENPFASPSGTLTRPSAKSMQAGQNIENQDL